MSANSSAEELSVQIESQGLKIREMKVLGTVFTVRISITHFVSFPGEQESA
jgi:hypothetical protein